MSSSNCTLRKDTWFKILTSVNSSKSIPPSCTLQDFNKQMESLLRALILRHLLELTNWHHYILRIHLSSRRSKVLIYSLLASWVFMPLRMTSASPIQYSFRLKWSTLVGRRRTTNIDQLSQGMPKGCPAKDISVYVHENEVFDQTIYGSEFMDWLITKECRYWGATWNEGLTEPMLSCIRK